MENFKNKFINLKISDGIFKPTGTSDLLISAIKEKVELHGDVLDLGAGSGYIGLSLLKIFNNKFSLFASDLSSKIINLIKLNAKNNNKKVQVKQGNLYLPWNKKKFQFIINDVSGISEMVAKISPWFNKISCKSGDDGTKLTNKIINQTNNYLLKDGIFFFPVLSFSNEQKIVNSTKKKFKFVKKIASKEWILPKEMYKKISILKSLKKKGFIRYKNKFGMLIWTTNIYIAYNSNMIHNSLKK